MTLPRTSRAASLAAGLLLAATRPAGGLAHPGEGSLAAPHDLLHGWLLGAGHGPRPLALALALSGAMALFLAVRSGCGRGRWPRRKEATIEGSAREARCRIGTSGHQYDHWSGLF